MTPDTTTPAPGLPGHLREPLERIHSAIELIVEGGALPTEIGRQEAAARALAPMLREAGFPRRAHMVDNAVLRLVEARELWTRLLQGPLVDHRKGALTVDDYVFDAFDSLCWALEDDDAPHVAPWTEAAAA